MVARDATQLALAPVRATLQQLEKEVNSVATTQTSTKHTAQKISDVLDTVVDWVGDALEARLVQFEDAQEKLMGVVEVITADSDVKDKDGSSPPPSPTLPLFEFPPS